MPLLQLFKKQTQSAAQSKHGRESERTSFVCRGRRTVEQRKKQAELSVISCFLGLAPSFLRGGPGRFVLVPSCSSAPLSGGLCRPRRNAALGPQETWLQAPPDYSTRLPTRVLLALLGIDLSSSHFLACGRRGEPPPKRLPVFFDNPERLPVSKTLTRSPERGVRCSTSCGDCQG